ncbi:MAG TPA: hypothetical protein VH112_13095 [Acidimicrobiales bacterium]|nr:hypothetical protein [Acidimicrobiales bacterium]
MATSPLLFAAAAVFLAAATAWASKRRQLVVARVTTVHPDRTRGRLRPPRERQ